MSHSVVIITDAHSADGFSLAGVETRVAEDASDGRKTLLGLLGDDRVGVMAMNDPWMDALSDRDRERIDSLYRPIVVGIPPAEVVAATSDERGSRLARLIRRAVGFEVKREGKD